MNTAEEVVGIQALLGRYCWLVDRREWDQWQLCFAPDGVFDVRGQRHEGRAQIVDYVRDALAEFKLIRHLCHAPEIHVDSDASASCRSYFELRATTLRGTDTVALGSYLDRLAKHDGGWVFAERRADFDYWVRVGEPWLGSG
jgi:hypothetical protein